MSAPPTRVAFLLPAAARFGAQRLSEPCARALGRADRLPWREAGRSAQLLRHFELIPQHWSVAALTRQADVGDAAEATWLRADPAYVRPDINGARLLACGDALALTADDSAALLPALKPLFGDAGFLIDAPIPARWYLRLPREAKLPTFATPDEALGADLFEHMAEGSEGRRWRSLLNEAQIVLHNHPWNAQRIAQGKPPVNSLWFWGGGTLPDHVRTSHACVHSGEEVAQALAHAAGVGGALPDTFALAEGDTVFDLDGVRDLALFERDWLLPAVAALRRGRLQSLALDLADGRTYAVRRSQRWRFWRMSIAQLDG